MLLALRRPIKKSDDQLGSEEALARRSTTVAANSQAPITDGDFEFRRESEGVGTTALRDERGRYLAVERTRSRSIAREVCNGDNVIPIRLEAPEVGRAEPRRREGPEGLGDLAGRDDLVERTPDLVVDAVRADQHSRVDGDAGVHVRRPAVVGVDAGGLEDVRVARAVPGPEGRRHLPGLAVVEAREHDVGLGEVAGVPGEDRLVDGRAPLLADLVEHVRDEVGPAGQDDRVDAALEDLDLRGEHQSCAAAIGSERPSIHPEAKFLEEARVTGHLDHVRGAHGLRRVEVEEHGVAAALPLGPPIFGVVLVPQVVQRPQLGMQSLTDENPRPAQVSRTRHNAHGHLRTIPRLLEESHSAVTITAVYGPPFCRSRGTDFYLKNRNLSLYRASLIIERTGQEM